MINIIINWLRQIFQWFLSKLRFKTPKKLVYRLPDGHPELIRRIRILLGSYLAAREIVILLEFLSTATNDEFELFVKNKLLREQQAT